MRSDLEKNISHWLKTMGAGNKLLWVTIHNVMQIIEDTQQSSESDNQVHN